MSDSAPAVTPAEEKLSILVLGGTGFIGPPQVRHALNRGHTVTVFNRGNRSGMFGDGVEELVGDRDATVGEGLSALAGERTWDAVIDNSGYLPRHVRDSVELLKGRTGRYLYISTVAVYDIDEPGVYPESAPLHELADPSVEEVTWETYGPLKAECDRIVRAELGDAATVVRPTYIVGPGDHTDRFTYWVERVREGGRMLAPARPDSRIQWVDVRDLSPWVVSLLEGDVAGTFNAAGPETFFTTRGLMWGLAGLQSEPVEFVWATPEVLGELELDLPMMSAEGVDWASANAASLAAGMTYRSLADTAVDIHEWWRSLPAERRAAPRRWPSDEAIAAAMAKCGG